MLIPSTLRMGSTSCLPQNCAVKIAMPLVRPNSKRMNTKNTWFDNPSAAMDASPNCPTMSTSIMFNEALMSC